MSHLHLCPKVKKTLLTLAFLSGVFCSGSTLFATPSNWASYNDFGTSGSSTGNVTSFTSGTNSLKDITTGANTGVYLSVTGITFQDGATIGSLSGDALAYFGSTVAPGLNNNGRAFVQSGPLTFTFSGLNASQLYDLAFYILDSESGHTNTFVVSGINSLTGASSTQVTASTTSVANDTATYVGQGGNPSQIVRFANISDSDGTFSVRMTTSGQEIISSMRLATGPVPEPSTYALFGLGALVMVVSHRIRSSKSA